MSSWRKQLTACDVFMAIIGPRWMDLLRSKSQMSGLRDYVRDEIALALRRKIAVVPVRVGSEGNLPPVPRAKDLPSDIRDLVYYQKHDVVHEHFARDVAGLIEAISRARKSSRPKRAFPWAWVSAAASIVLSLSALVYVLHDTSVIWAPSAQALTTGSVPSRLVTECDRLAATFQSFDPRAVAPGVAIKDIDHRRAVVACQEATTKYPGEARFHFQLGRAHGAGNELDLSLAANTKAIELDPKYAAAYNNRAGNYYDKADYDRAIADLTVTIGLNPKFEDAFANRGQAYFAKQDYDHAVADYTVEIALNAKNHVAYNRRGRAYSSKQDYDHGAADFTVAIELNPKEHTYYRDRGFAYAKLGRKEEAMADFQKALLLEPNDQYSRDWLAQLAASSSTTPNSDSVSTTPDVDSVKNWLALLGAPSSPNPNAPPALHCRHEQRDSRRVCWRR